MTDEEFVRANWADALDPDSDEEMGIFFYSSHAGLNFQAWEAAAAFTRERLEQIRQLEEEIREGEFVSLRFLKDRGDCWKRILARLESALADLKRDMRTAAPDGARSDAND